MRWNDLIGSTVGPYRITEELGRGGAAHVFRAYDEQRGRQVAFKALPIETEDRVAFMQRFAREAVVIRALDHPGIVRVYDSGETDEFVYLALQLVEGVTLRQRIASQRISTQAACQYMVQIARALHHAHQQGIIHRDVKPSNILLDQERPGKVLLTDFGTAKIINASGLTKTGATVGTPEYMSPEQAEGRQDVDHRSDIYSLGCTLYETLASRPPFVGGTLVSILYQHVHAQPTYIRSYNPEVPRELWMVLRTCLAKRPEERYGSAERLAEELQPFADGLIQPTPAPWSTSTTGSLTTNERGSGGAQRTLRTGQLSMTPPEAAALSDALTLRTGVPDGAGPIPLNLGDPAPNSRNGLPGRKAPSTLNLPSHGPAQTGTGRLLGQQFAADGHPDAQEAAPAPADVDDRPTIKEPTLPPHPDVLPTVKNPAAPAQHPGSRAPSSGGFGQQNGAYPPIGHAPRSGGYRGPLSGPLGTPMPAPTSNPFPAPNSGYRRNPNSRPMSEGYRGPASGAIPPNYIGAASGPLNGSYRNPNSRPAAGQMRNPTSRPVSQGLAAPQSVRQRTVTFADMDHQQRRRRVPMPLLAISTLVLLGIGVTFAIGNLKPLTSFGAPPRATPIVKPTATQVVPTATATVSQPTASATTNPQAALDAQAASAFRAITIATFSDGSCSSGNMTTQFSGGAAVFINLCTSDNYAAGPVTVTVQQNGSTVRTLISGLFPSRNAYYSQGHTLSNGSYDMLITMRINGTQAIAKDIPFTVG